MTEKVERERLDVDILFVGAGPATLASVIRLADLCKKHEVEMPAVLMVEKAPSLGGHQLSGSVMDPRAIKELIPDFLDQGFPFHYEVGKELVYLLTRKRALRLPMVPPQMANHGNLVISLSDVVK